MIQADALIDTFGASSNSVNLFALYLTSADTNVTTYDVSLSESPSSSNSFEYAEFPDGGYRESDHEFAMIPHGQWTHLRYSFDLAGARVTFSENDVEVVNHSLQVPSFVAVEVQIGAPQLGEPGGPFTEFLDNVTIDVVP